MWPRLALIVLLSGPWVPAAGAAFDAEGYRLPPYRSPVNAPLEGAIRLDTEGVRDLLRRHNGAVSLIDVYPLGWQDDMFLQAYPHRSLPGATWLPNVGSATLEPPWAAYFHDGLETLTGGRTEAPLVFFCRRHCWLSWNAARRALALGYRQVYWYPDGIDGWQDAGYKHEALCPSPLGDTASLSLCRPTEREYQAPPDDKTNDKTNDRTGPDHVQAADRR